jgi:hypothetical protein
MTEISTKDDGANLIVHLLITLIDLKTSEKATSISPEFDPSGLYVLESSGMYRKIPWLNFPLEKMQTFVNAWKTRTIGILLLRNVLILTMRT